MDFQRFLSIEKSKSKPTPAQNERDRALLPCCCSLSHISLSFLLSFSLSFFLFLLFLFPVSGSFCFSAFLFFFSLPKYLPIDRIPCLALWHSLSFPTWIHFSHQPNKNQNKSKQNDGLHSSNSTAQSPSCRFSPCHVAHSSPVILTLTYKVTNGDRITPKQMSSGKRDVKMIVSQIK